MDEIIRNKLKNKGKDIFIETLSCMSVNEINKMIEQKGKERKRVPFVLFFNKNDIDLITVKKEIN